MSPPPAEPTDAVTAVEFAALMSVFDPFEPKPHIAVAVSGGADSLALAVLLHRWARARGGTVTALTVDHGLRPGAAAEAARVGNILGGQGLAHHILRWHGAKPTANVQAAARRARYALLSDWCARRGVLHLALGHQLEDQAETFLLRLGRGSGLDGLAAMPAVTATGDVRLLRPLLGVPRARLEATLRRRGLIWIEDPSNRDPAHARVRLRMLQPKLTDEGLTPRRLAATADRLGRARAALERTTAAVLARAAAVHPAGFVRLDPGPLAAAAPEVGLRALSRIAMLVGGQEYAPRLERLERLYGRIVAGVAMGVPMTGVTLGGCRFMPHGGGILVVREPATLRAQPVRAGERLVWDHRFALRIARGARPRRGDLVLGPLGSGGWAEVRAQVSAQKPATLAAFPAAVRPGLPALRDGLGVISVPHLGFERGRNCRLTMMCAGFSPRISLTIGSFTVA